jgi:hypothetical protein
VIEPLVGAVADGAVGEERGEAGVHGAEKVLAAAHVEEGLLLAGERGVRQVLGGRRGAHRQLGPRRADAGQETVAGSEHALADRGGERRAEDGLPCRVPPRRELLGVLRVEAREDALEAALEILLSKEQAVGPGRGREAVEDPDPERLERAEKLAERGVLAADRRHVMDADLAEVERVACGTLHGRPGSFDSPAAGALLSSPSASRRSTAQEPRSHVGMPRRGRITSWRRSQMPATARMTMTS